MPPVRSISSLKQPAKTERSHEENQERAYIAASRRSDRSIEARVESARRASEIHKKRTGRALRVTEKDVMNEEMYEEEDDDMPWAYRRLALSGSLSAMDPDFQRRMQANIAFQLERSKMLNQVVFQATNGVNGQLHNSPPLFSDQGQFMNPGMMQMSPSMYQSPGIPPHSLSRTPSGFRQTPYPLPNAQDGRPNFHQRSQSMAMQDLPTFQQQQQAHSALPTPNEAPNMADRRFSLPPRAITPQTPQPQQGKRSATQRGQSSSRLSPGNSHSGSTATTPTSQQHMTPPLPPPQQRHNSFAGPYNTNFNVNRASLGPLTPTLPLETQHILAGNPSWMSDPTLQQDAAFHSMMFNQNSVNQQHQPFYSYNPNMSTKPNESKSRVPTSTGLDQTLLPTSLDTNVSSITGSAIVDTPTSGDSTAFNSSTTDQGFGLGFTDTMFDFTAFNSSQSSGHQTPDEFASFVNNDMFGDHQFAS